MIEIQVELEFKHQHIDKKNCRYFNELKLDNQVAQAHHFNQERVKVPALL